MIHLIWSTFGQTRAWKELGVDCFLFVFAYFVDQDLHCE